MSRKTYLVLMVMIMAIGTYFYVNSGNMRKKVNIGRSELKIEDGHMTPESLWALGRISNVAVSADGKHVAYQTSYFSIGENAGHTVIYTMTGNGDSLRLITRSSRNETAPAWIDNRTIAFLAPDSKGIQQLWSVDYNGRHRRQLSHADRNIDGFLFSPDGSRVLLVMNVPNPLVPEHPYADLPESGAKIANDLMFRHWDSWTTELPHPFIASVKDGKVMADAFDLLQDQPYESPMLPFGGIEQFAWTPDGKQLAYTCRKKTGKEYSTSTDSDIFLYSIETGETVNLCKLPGETDLNMGYDTNPQFSPDGTFLAWQSMERDGYESDRNRLYVMDMETKRKWSVSENFDSNVDHFIWDRGSERLYFIGSWQGCMSIFMAGLDGRIVPVSNDVCDFNSLAWGADRRLIVTAQSLNMATEVYSLDTQRGMKERISHENDRFFADIDKVKTDARMVTTTDGKEMLTWVIYPPHFDPERKYPTLLFCEGGPQNMVSQFWSYRWNFMLMAHQGYIIVAPNRRGVPGFGQEWLEEISGDYTGQCMKDYLSAIDDIAKEPYVDSDRLGCIGASFGGYSVYWLAGNHEKRFKCFIAHDGMFNTQQDYSETEEMWFPNWDYGGAPWENDNLNRLSVYAQSPHLYVDRWDTPILCIHGEKDYRIMYSQAVSAFTSARMRGIDAQLLLFPDENHWVSKPQNGIAWQRTFFAWLDKYLK